MRSAASSRASWPASLPGGGRDPARQVGPAGLSSRDGCSLWATTGVGILCGLGEFMIAGASTLFVLGILVVGLPLDRWLYGRGGIREDDRSRLSGNRTGRSRRMRRRHRHILGLRRSAGQHLGRQGLWLAGRRCSRTRRIGGTLGNLAHEQLPGKGGMPAGRRAFPWTSGLTYDGPACRALFWPGFCSAEPPGFWPGCCVFWRCCCSRCCCSRCCCCDGFLFSWFDTVVLLRKTAAEMAPL